jgi:sigma-E factor negative regulatory protein RseB
VSVHAASASGPRLGWRQSRPVVAAVIAAVVTVGPSYAAGASPSAVAPPAPGASAPTLSASQWLSRIRDAAINRSYQGTMTFTAGGGAVSSSRVAHYCDGPERFERVEGLDGQVRQQFRHNDQVVTLWPASHVAVVEQQDGVADFPALPAVAQRALAHYTLQWVGAERVSGFNADVLLLAPRDGHRFGQRLWAERESGLLLRADMLGPQGDVLETSAFSEVVLGPKIQPDIVRGPMTRLDGYQVIRPKVVKTRLESEGWVLSRPVPGFQLVSCSRRPLDLNGGAASASGVQVLQAVFSDGLAQVSIFVEPYDPQRHKPMRSVMGATHTAMSRRGDWWLTVMGEVPMPTLQLFEAVLERKR